MQTRPLALIGLVLLGLAGCQSYFPYSHGPGGPYPSMAPGTYAPPSGTLPQGARGAPNTYQPGAASSGSGSRLTETPSANSPAINNSKPVPKYPDAGSPPATLGTPDDADDPISRPTGSLRDSPAQLDSVTDDSDESMTAFGEENFSAPRSLRPVSGTDDADEMPRQARKPTPDPYSFDRKGYAWLRGVATRESNGWRVRYNNDPLNDDRYGGSLMIVGDEKIERLLDDDTIVVWGRVDPSATDQRGKPIYRVDRLNWIKPKAE